MYHLSFALYNSVFTWQLTASYLRDCACHQPTCNDVCRKRFPLDSLAGGIFMFVASACWKTDNFQWKPKVTVGLELKQHSNATIHPTSIALRRKMYYKDTLGVEVSAS